ncbi:MAG: hypothetical protein COZ15_02005, partial [Elusimicrobia bacterium CG_4_10_14_3_um_filter_49_12_50_7]
MSNPWGYFSKKTQKCYNVSVMKFTSLIYGAATGIKRFLYAKGIRKKELMPSFVISVGNISAGGTGKTAFVIDLCRMLAGKKRTAVVTRGYKGKTK